MSRNGIDLGPETPLKIYVLDLIEDRGANIGVDAFVGGLGGFAGKEWGLFLAIVLLRDFFLAGNELLRFVRDFVKVVAMEVSLADGTGSMIIPPLAETVFAVLVTTDC
jgi:hypothetical protein